MVLDSYKFKINISFQNKTNLYFVTIIQLEKPASGSCFFTAASAYNSVAKSTLKVS